MKKVIVWAMVDKNRALVNEHSSFLRMQWARETFRRKTDHGIIVLDTHLYETLTEKSPPFPGHDVIIISDDPDYLLDAKNTRTALCTSLSTIFEYNDERIVNPQNIIIIGSGILFGSVFERFQDEVDEIFLVELQETLSSKEVFPFIDLEHWEKMEPQLFSKDPNNVYESKFIHYVNTKPKSLS